MNTCRFCKTYIAPSETMVRYGKGSRNAAHATCFLDSGKPLTDLRPYALERLPYFKLKELGRLGELAERFREIHGDNDASAVWLERQAKEGDGSNG